VSENGYQGEMLNLYRAGTERNIATLYGNVTEGRFENATVSRAVDGALTTILSREATMRRTQLTVQDSLRENRQVKVDLLGLRV
jgi:hypothetical protein